MILNSQPKQLTLKEDGQILWQADASNPLPGLPIATLRKGEKQLNPDFVLLDGAEPLRDLDPAVVVAYLKTWMDQHINTVLGPLTGLTKEEGISGPAKDIAVLLHDALGIMPRQDLEPLIAGLDPETRKVLRQRHVRLGPVLVFVPELNKPAAVKLRATLWWLWNDRALPAPLPKDGVVSMIVDESTIDPVYQRAIGYPVYGGRAIRVDMLDRLISAIYDNAKDGTFKATHAMAEWMGCSIPDLYKIIESMGHKKSHDPAEQPVAVETPVVAEIAAVAVEAEVPVEEVPVAEVPVAEAAPVAPVMAPVIAPVIAVKPELATFRLKRGKANEAARPPRSENRAPRRAPDQKSDHGSAVPKERESFKDKKKDDGYKGKPKGDSFKGDRPRGRDTKPEKFEKKPTSFEARPKQMGDSPFAMLEQLKAGMKDK